jgi:outer membrane protein TolC
MHLYGTGETMHRRFATVLILVLFAPAAASSDDSPRARVEQVARAAWSGPDLEQTRAGLSAESAAQRLEIHPGAPFTELTREGISQFFSEAQNATYFVRLGAPFNAPWHHGARQDALEATERYVAAGERLAAIEAAGRAVDAWLLLAAGEARLAVYQAQMDRLVAALELQRRRLELGEVSGSEVTQLELERLRLSGEVQALRVDRGAGAAELARLAGPAVPLPRPADLRGLHEAIAAPLGEHEPGEERLESSPALTAATLDAERVRLDGERARKTVWGRPEAEISWEHIPTIEDAESYDAVGLRLRFPLPLGSLGKKQAAEAAARQRQAAAEQERTRREVAARIEIETTRARVADEAVADLAAVESELPAVERSITERYRLGATPYLEYIDGLARLDEVRMQAIEARLAALRSRLVLAVLTGDLELFPLPDPAVEIDP